ncbi:YigZ family protein [Caldicellulosiruptoraceae bacterium PP1]
MYLTIKENVQVEWIEKKSVFISSIFHVENQEEVDFYLNNIRSKYYDATHNVYAYTYGIDYPIQKYSDDGEPQGTAGLPVMEVIKRNNLKNVLIVVTRYFGGILLGAGGLTRAYSKSASLAIEKAGILRYIDCKRFKIIVEYSFLEQTKKLLERFSSKIIEINYSDVVDLDIVISKEEFDSFIKEITELTSGGVLIDNVCDTIEAI